MVMIDILEIAPEIGIIPEATQIAFKVNIIHGVEKLS
jgi:hypothetical protein